MGRMTLIKGDERRRRWSEEERERIWRRVRSPAPLSPRRRVARISARASFTNGAERRGESERGRKRLLAGDHRNAAATVADIAAVERLRPRRYRSGVKGDRVRIGASAPTALVVATLKALRS